MAKAKSIGRRRKTQVGGPNHGVKPSRGRKKSLRAQRVSLRAGLVKPGER